MKRYINFKGPYGIETCDEFDYDNSLERGEAHRCLKEYQMVGDYYYYLSQRCTNDWRNK